MGAVVVHRLAHLLQTLAQFGLAQQNRLRLRYIVISSPSHATSQPASCRARRSELCSCKIGFVLLMCVYILRIPLRSRRVAREPSEPLMGRWPIERARGVPGWML